MKNILITGGTGFVGSHLVEELLKQKSFNLVVLYRDLDPRSYFLEQKFDKKVIMAAGDIKNFKRIFDLITKYEIDFVFHLAAQATVEVAYDNPVETLASNIMGTVNVLEACRLYGKVRGIIVASSDKAYGKTKKECEENSPLKGDHPYEVSKSSADLIAQMFYKTYNLPVVVTRFGNIYGEGDLKFSRIVPGICQVLVEKRVLELRSDGTFVRDYVYVKDVIRGYLLLVKNIDKIRGEVFNLSSEDNLSVLDLIKKSEKILKTKIKYKIVNTAKNEIPYQHLNYSKAKKLLGYQPKYNLEKTLNRVFDWYQLKLGGKND